MHILRVDSSTRSEDSISRKLADDVVAQHVGATITTRDLSNGIPHIDAGFSRATFTPPEARSDADKAALAVSDDIVAEVQAADLVVISMPVYNFSIPSTLKAWIDQLARVGVTFHYTENGPVGLLEGKRVIVVSASGGTPVGADYEFASPYLTHVLGFMGLTDVSFIGAAGEEGLVEAERSIQALAA
ncbi:NAD(P)H-dependent oxidoreductase [Aliiroseovarius sp. F20344]|uniref:FMN-dependent NADH-azoreductase n=1 Tax=Aliiroseovarius sp. F20344 TaxID=2926414 RepID=UPI001FF68A25|nr:NAD(P)H-dependent oxidoreductase [Aliiroseovarius sp. F20344]MCK0142169.1 NAD(P)H-dependent oxidoreductase [Aliiroseovarius sp. F20344]